MLAGAHHGFLQPARQQHTVGQTCQCVKVGQLCSSASCSRCGVTSNHPSMRCGVPRAIKAHDLAQIAPAGLSLPVPSRRQVASNGVAGWAAWRAISAVMRCIVCQTVCVQPRGSVLAAGRCCPAGHASGCRRSRCRLAVQSHRAQRCGRDGGESSSLALADFLFVRLRSVMSDREHPAGLAVKVRHAHRNTVRGGHFGGGW